MKLTERQFELIEVALESAVSACGSPWGRGDNPDPLAKEYQDALNAVRKLRRYMEGPTP